MNIKQLTMKVPLLMRMHRQVQRARTRRLLPRLIAQLEGHPNRRCHQIAEVLRSAVSEERPVDAEWNSKIEAQRDKLLSNNGPLVDGSLGDGGLYDADVSILEACQVSKPPKQAQFLYSLVRATRPNTVLELGTNVGISTSYLAAALRENGDNGRVVTLDASPYRQRLARDMHAALELDNVEYVNGLFTDTLDATLADLGTIDFAFIDGHHQYKPTLDYFDQIVANAANDAVFVFDDIRWSDGMKRAWTEIQNDPRVGVAIDLHFIGLCLLQGAEEFPRLISDPVRPE